MKKDLQLYLINKYPEFFNYLKDTNFNFIDDEIIFEEISKSIENRKPILPIQFGFECGDGWFHILDSLMSAISDYTNNINIARKTEFRHKLPKWLKKQAYRFPMKMELIRRIMVFVSNMFPKGLPPIPPINITQIKEKYGGLRFYYIGGDDFIGGLVRMAEYMSYRTCEFCGTTKDVGHTEGWIITCCKSCFNSNDGIKNLSWKPIEMN